MTIMCLHKAENIINYRTVVWDADWPKSNDFMKYVFGNTDLQKGRLSIRYNWGAWRLVSVSGSCSSTHLHYLISPQSSNVGCWAARLEQLADWMAGLIEFKHRWLKNKINSFTSQRTSQIWTIKAFIHFSLFNLNLLWSSLKSILSIDKIENEVPITFLITAVLMRSSKNLLLFTSIAVSYLPKRKITIKQFNT